MLTLNFKTPYKTDLLWKWWLDVDIEFHWKTRECKVREDDDGKMFLQNFLGKDTITCFVFLAKKGLIANENLKTSLLGRMWSLGTGNWILIFERLILIIGSSHDHPQFCLSDTRDQDAIIVFVPSFNWDCPRVSSGPFLWRIQAFKSSEEVLHAVQILLVRLDFVILIICFVPF